MCAACKAIEPPPPSPPTLLPPLACLPACLQFIYAAAVNHCVEIATHRHGCCVLQRCIDSASNEQKGRLMVEVASNALVLSQDPFG